MVVRSARAALFFGAVGLQSGVLNLYFSPVRVFKQPHQ
jgi:hypothetical protein